ncbi:hypothetical protein ACN20G_07190 [Streptomyces sp. BI20]|uniref:hypothetical protein n=1 Tax=Streptomyces sp. BI20 TaxID=3403460 RepID=UPI003C75C0ED
MTTIMTTTKMTEISVAASPCLLGSALLLAAPSIKGHGTGLSLSLGTSAGFAAPAIVRERNERPLTASAAVAKTAMGYGFGATDAGTRTPQHEQHQNVKHQNVMWAFRGLEPWSDPA